MSRLSYRDATPDDLGFIVCFFHQLLAFFDWRQILRHDRRRAEHNG